MSNKYTDIQKEIYRKNKYFGKDSVEKMCNEILERTSKMIVEAIELVEKQKEE